MSEATRRDPIGTKRPSLAGKRVSMSVEAGAGIYVHVPFCSAICPYCDFAVRRGGPARRAGYVATLAAEAQLWGVRGFPATSFDTVYLGGGTPSALLPDQLAELLAALHRHLPVAATPRVSLEANPEDVTPGRVDAWRRLGVHTLSLGVQSFADSSLRFLGRRHDAAGARRAVEWALAGGLPVVSVDLIYGLPGQPAAAWREDLASAARLAPPHLSCYQLTVHDGTAFGTRRARGTLRELPEEEQASLFRLTHELLADAGYAAYEVSNFARRPEHRSLHNRKYWRHVPYLGLGPSAHSFDGTARWWNERRLGDWQAAIGEDRPAIAGREPIGSRERALEHLLLGLRCSDGVDLRLLARLGMPLERHPLLPRLVDQGLLRRDGDRLLPTLAGWCVADGLATALAPELAPPGDPAALTPAPRAGAPTR